MFKLNNKGFTLVEVLAVVIILGVLTTIMVPTVSYVINQNKKSNYENVEKSILNAAKMYVSDNRYDMSIGECNDGIAAVTSFNDGKIMLTSLASYLSSEEIINPMDDSKKLDFNNSYVYIYFNCNSKEFIYEEFSGNDCDGKSCLKWK